jgi:hypothetical protein
MSEYDPTDPQDPTDPSAPDRLTVAERLAIALGTTDPKAGAHDAVDDASDSHSDRPSP